MTTSATAGSQPSAAARRACASCAWASASGLPRVPMTQGRVGPAFFRVPAADRHLVRSLSAGFPTALPGPGLYGRSRPVRVTALPLLRSGPLPAPHARARHRDHLRRDRGRGGRAVRRRPRRDPRQRGPEPDRRARAPTAAWCRRSRPAPMSKSLDRLIGRALSDAGLRFEELDGIAAAAGPGLIGGVLVGLTTAKALALVAAQAASRRQPSRGPRADRAAHRRDRLPLPAAARLGRPHAARRGARRRRLRPPRRDRSTTRSARRSTRPRSSSGSPIRADRRWNARRRAATRSASRCRARCSGGRSRTSRSPA